MRKHAPSASGLFLEPKREVRFVVLTRFKVAWLSLDQWLHFMICAFTKNRSCVFIHTPPGFVEATSQKQLPSGVHFFKAIIRAILIPQLRCHSKSPFSFPWVRPLRASHWHLGRNSHPNWHFLRIGCRLLRRLDVRPPSIPESPCHPKTDAHHHLPLPALIWGHNINQF